MMKKFTFETDYEINDRVYLNHPESQLYIVSNIYANVAFKFITYELTDAEGNTISAKGVQLSKTKVFV